MDNVRKTAEEKTQVMVFDSRKVMKKPNEIMAVSAKIIARTVMTFLSLGNTRTKNHDIKP